MILGVMSETISWTNFGAILGQFWEKFQNDFSDNTDPSYTKVLHIGNKNEVVLSKICRYIGIKLSEKG